LLKSIVNLPGTRGNVTRVIIIGAGKIGTQLAAYLIQEKHDVAIIENNPERAGHASNRLDCLVIRDDGNNPRSLEDAGIARADALVCATDSDEINMVISGIAETRYPALLKIACVRNREYLAMNGPDNRAGGEGGNRPKVLGVDFFVHPDVEAARSAVNAIEHGAVGDILSFDGADYELGSIEIAKNSALDGLALRNYRDIVPGETLVTLVERGGSGFLPDGSAVLKSGDRVHIFAGRDDMRRVFGLCGSAARTLGRIGIAGGGETGMLIAESLLRGGGGTAGEVSGASGFFRRKGKSVLSFLKHFAVKRKHSLVLIENDYEASRELAERFPDALVLNEDISDENFIAEESLNGLDLIVTATGDQALNVITALYLKARGVKRAIAMVKSDGYGAIARRLGVDVVISIKSVVVDAILSRLGGGGVTGVHRLGAGAIDVFEMEIKSGMPIVDRPITDFRVSGGGLLMHVNRDGKSFIPHGGYVFRAGDRIVVLVKNSSEKELEKFFGR
jgi:trk system potassium uptake protein TrkA